jgi:hypothetical protein
MHSRKSRLAIRWLMVTAGAGGLKNEALGVTRGLQGETKRPENAVGVSGRVSERARGAREGQKTAGCGRTPAEGLGTGGHSGFWGPWAIARLRVAAATKRGG